MPLRVTCGPPFGESELKSPPIRILSSGWTTPNLRIIPTNQSGATLLDNLSAVWCIRRARTQQHESGKYGRGERALRGPNEKAMNCGEREGVSLAEKCV